MPKTGFIWNERFMCKYFRAISETGQKATVEMDAGPLKPTNRWMPLPLDGIFSRLIDVYSLYFPSSICLIRAQHWCCHREFGSFDRIPLGKRV